MDFKLKGNGVLANSVDYFCLVCESRLYNGIDALDHINKPDHTKNFELTNYFENKDDCVRKIKKWYFCELCNLLLRTATKVRLHVIELRHVEYKNDRLLERNGTFVVALSNVKIHDRAWNGIIEETCVICNTEFDDEKIHVNETMHIIKLIQSKTEFDANKNIYRKTDDSSIQCLTCNVVFALSSIDTHFNQTEHIKLYQEATNSVLDKILQNDKKASNAKEENFDTKQTEDFNQKVKRPATETNIVNVDGECHKKTVKDVSLTKKEDTDLEKEVESPITEKNIERKNIENVNGEYQNKSANDFNVNKELEKQVTSPGPGTNIIRKNFDNVDGECHKKNVKDINIGKKQNTDLEKEVKSPITDTNISSENLETVNGECHKKKQNTDLEKEVKNPISETNIGRKNLENVDGECHKKNVKEIKINKKQNTDLEKEVKSTITDTNISNKNLEIVNGECHKKNAKDINVNKNQNKELEKQVTSPVVGTNFSKKSIINIDGECQKKNAEDVSVDKKQNTDLKKEVICATTETNIERKSFKNVDGECQKKNAKDVNINKIQNTNLEKEVKNPISETNIGRKDLENVDGECHKKNVKDIKINKKQNTDLEKEVKSTITDTNISRKNLENVDGDYYKKNAKAVKKNDKGICEILNARNYITKHKTDKLWCILCHWLVEPNDVKSHTSHIHHQTLLKFHKKRLSKQNANQITSLDVNCKIGQANNTYIKDYDQVLNILDSIENFHNNGIQINFETHNAFCLKCSTELKFNKAFIESHIKKHATNINVNNITETDDKTTNPSTEEDENILDAIQKFQNNNIKINFENQTAFCKKCSVSLDFKKIRIEDHIEEHNKALQSNDEIGQSDCTNKVNDEQDSSIKDSVDNFQKNNVVINLKLKTAHCKKCLISLDFNKTFIENHIKEHANMCMSDKKKTKGSQATSGNENRKSKNTINKKNSTFTTPAAKKKIIIKESTIYTEEDIKRIAAENDMTYMPNSKEVHCNKCNTKIPSFPKNLSEHIAGYAHKANMGKTDPSTDRNELLLKNTINMINNKKVALDSFITSFVTIDGFSKDVVLNNRICINFFSFGLVIRTGNMLICKVCDTIANVDQFDQHIVKYNHQKYFNDSLVLVDGDEFIREVQSKGFHCGYCNLFESSWKSIQNHVQSSVHRDCKTAGQWRLQQYMPHIQKQYFEDKEFFELYMVTGKINTKG